MYARGMGSSIDQTPHTFEWWHVFDPVSLGQDVGQGFRDSICDTSVGQWFERCRVPSIEEIVTSTSDYGGSLSPASRAQAEEMARTVIAADRAAHPELYNELREKPTDFLPVALVIAGIAALTVFKG